MISSKSSFLAPSIITEWNWDGDLDCETVLFSFDESEQIENSQQSFLYQCILSKKKQQAAKAGKKDGKKKTLQYIEQNETILPAPIHKMTIPQIKETLKALGLSQTGNRNELVKRLEKSQKIK